MNHFEDTQEAALSTRERRPSFDDKGMQDVPLGLDSATETNERHDAGGHSDDKDGLGVAQAFIQSEESKEETSDPSHLRTRASSLSFVIESG